MIPKVQCHDSISKLLLRATIAALASAPLLPALLVFGGITASAAQAQTYTVLYNFQGRPSDGSSPVGALAVNAGTLYGVTSRGGATNKGAVYGLSNAGAVTFFVSFGAGMGEYPAAGLVRDPAGNLYGAAGAGGAFGSGTVFKIDTTGALTVLHNFHYIDGVNPSGGLVLDSDGNLYGNTFSGGTGCAHYGCGVVYKLDPAGKETVLHKFTGTPDGRIPVNGLVLDATGNIYGAAQLGGSTNNGVLFKIDTAGNETVLYSFKGAPDGVFPGGDLILDSGGNLYGTTGEGGAYDDGTVFKFDTNTGTETILYSFAGGADGTGPLPGLVRDLAGNLFGTTSRGSNTRCDNSGCGAIFELNTSGKETILHRFVAAQGAFPNGGLLRTTAGSLYGTTFVGGTGKDGVVFEFKP